jgi:hypothetical protein
MSILNLFKNKFILIVLCLLAAGLLVLYLIVFKKHQQPGSNLPTLPGISLNNTPVLAQPDIGSLASQIPQLPTQLPILQIQPAQFSHQQAIDIASKLQFTGEPQIVQGDVGPIYLWQDQEKYLSVSVNDAKVGYGLNSAVYKKSPKNPVLTTEEADSSVSALLNTNTLPLPSNLSIEMSHFQYLKVAGPSYTNVDSKDQADYAQLDYTYKVNNYPIDNSTNSPFLSVILGPQGSIAKLEYQEPLISYVPLETYPLKTTKILDEIKSKPQISILTKPGWQITDPSDYQSISKFTLTQLKIVYYLPDTKTSLLQPVFKFDGSGTLPGTDFTAVTFLPAIEDQFYVTGPTIIPATTP